MNKVFDILWVDGQNTMDRDSDMPWVERQDAIGRGLNILWVGGSIYTMYHE